MPITVVETPQFIRQADGLLSEDERAALVEYAAHNLEAGDLIQGTGGIRKLRWALPGRGKSGGARVIYFFHGTTVPAFLLSVFAKNRKVDLTQAERNEMRKLTAELAETY